MLIFTDLPDNTLLKYIHIVLLIKSLLFTNNIFVCKKKGTRVEK